MGAELGEQPVSPDIDDVVAAAVGPSGLVGGLPYVGYLTAVRCAALA